MNKWPTKLNVQGIEYEIVYSSNPDQVDGLNRFYGTINYEKRKINILRQAPDTTFNTLLHEIIHAIFQENNLLKRCVKKEEAFINQFTSTLIDTLVRNNLVELPNEEMGNNG